MSIILILIGFLAVTTCQLSYAKSIASGNDAASTENVGVKGAVVDAVIDAVNVGIDTMIVGGTNANQGDAPWSVYVHYMKNNEPYFCGGSILNRRTILTAAHCMDLVDRRNVWIEYGSLNANQGGTRRFIINIKIHPQYDKNTFQNDIALLITDEPIQYKMNVRNVMLPGPDSEDPIAGSKAFISGWGDLIENGTDSPILQKALVNIVDRDLCRMKYEVPPPRNITDTMICASSPGIDTCQGDSGGALMKYRSNYQIGIVSFGRGCARPEFPGVYTQVSKFFNWIMRNWA